MFTQVSLRIKSTDELVHQIQSVVSEQQEGSKQIKQALHDMNDSTSEVRNASYMLPAVHFRIFQKIWNRPFRI